jgi:phosphoglycerate dehydrogenase-like enzyme
MRSGQWQTRLGESLAGKTLGVVGLGRLGQRVARVGQAFELTVISWSTHLDPELARSLQVEPVTKAELLDRSDIVTVHLKLGERSVGTIGAPELRAMKPSAYLVNTSRGPIVDQAALVQALSEGWIAGAALDVYDEEPLPPDHPLRSAPRTLLTPHVGYVVREGYETYYTDAVEDIIAWRAGSPIRIVSS